MARFSEYLDTSYLPGEVYSAGLSDYTLDPQAKIDYITSKRFKFRPQKDEGGYFEQFLNLQKNPELLAQTSFGKSPGFFEAMSMFGGSGYN